MVRSVWTRVQWISVKFGLAAAAVAAGPLVGLWFAGIVLPTWALLFPCGAFAGGYIAATHVISRRVELARSILRQIRHSRFENLEAARMPRGDELNDLIWQVYRTGQVLEGEIEGLRRMEHYRREFLGDVSHELKTPIFAIRGFAETLQNGALSDPAVNHSFVERILRNADRLSSLVRDLGEISRLETGQLRMTVAPFSVSVLFHETVEAVDSVARDRGVLLLNRVPEGLPTLDGDVHHIRQVLTNLVENAIKYNDAGGRVELVAGRAASGLIRISVVDDGIGIRDEHLARITERFYRVDKSRSRAQGGTGLGLAIVKHILAAHTRTLHVESTPGGGSTFSFVLPVSSDPGT